MKSFGREGERGSGAGTLKQKASELNRGGLESK